MAGCLLGRHDLHLAHVEHCDRPAITFTFEIHFGVDPGSVEDEPNLDGLTEKIAQRLRGIGLPGVVELRIDFSPSLERRSAALRGFVLGWVDALPTPIAACMTRALPH